MYTERRECLVISKHLFGAQGSPRKIFLHLKNKKIIIYSCSYMKICPVYQRANVFLCVNINNVFT